MVDMFNINLWDRQSRRPKVASIRMWDIAIGLALIGLISVLLEWYNLFHNLTVMP